jgi:hypothetical protein
MGIDLNTAIFHNITIADAIIGVSYGILAALIIYLFTKLKNTGKGWFFLLNKNAKIQNGNQLYCYNLSNDLLHISHPWMKQGQTLDDILVPVNFTGNKTSEREELEIYLKRTFEKQENPRILILGKPGTGKSIAMRVIARTIIATDKERNRTPVVLTFSDIKGVKDDQDLKQKIVEQLRIHQFEKHEKDKTTAKQFVDENLYTGKIILLFDGYDELEKSERKEASKFLNYFLKSYPNITAVISSRTAVYEHEHAFNKLEPSNVYMADFTKFAILRFLTQWQFD